LRADGRDSVAWHDDTIGRGSTEDTVVTPVLRPVHGPSAGEGLRAAFGAAVGLQDLMLEQTTRFV